MLLGEIFVHPRIHIPVAVVEVEAEVLIEDDAARIFHFQVHVGRGVVGPCLRGDGHGDFRQIHLACGGVVDGYCRLCNDVVGPLVGGNPEIPRARGERLVAEQHVLGAAGFDGGGHAIDGRALGIAGGSEEVEWGFALILAADGGLQLEHGLGKACALHGNGRGGDTLFHHHFGLRNDVLAAVVGGYPHVVGASGLGVEAHSAVLGAAGLDFHHLIVLIVALVGGGAGEKIESPVVVLTIVDHVEGEYLPVLGKVAAGTHDVLKANVDNGVLHDGDGSVLCHGDFKPQEEGIALPPRGFGGQDAHGHQMVGAH